MNTTCLSSMAVREPKTENSALYRWGKLIVGLLVIWFFVFIVAPSLQGFSMIADVQETIRARNIDATALSYMEIQEFGDADVHIRDAMKY